MPRMIEAAVLLAENGEFSLEPVELEEPRADEVLVRIEAAGICHTDIAVQAIVNFPAVLGHEGTGIIEAVGSDVNSVCMGDTVILAYGWCGKCPHCIQEARFHCAQSFQINFGGCRLDGSRTVVRAGSHIFSAFFQQSSFATHAVVPARDLVKVDPSLPPELRAALPCGVSTGAGSILNVFRLRPGDDILIFGAGSVGLSAVLTARNLEAGNIIIVDVNRSRLNLAMELGATLAIDPTKESVSEVVNSAIPGGVAAAFDTSGAASVWETVFDCLAMGGLFGFVAVPAPFESFSFRPFAMAPKGVGIQFIIQGQANSRDLIPKLIDWHTAGKFEVDRLVTTYPFDKINDAVASMRNGSAIKPVLLMKHRS